LWLLDGLGSRRAADDEGAGIRDCVVLCAGDAINDLVAAIVWLPSTQVLDPAFENPAVSSSWTNVQNSPISPGPELSVNFHVGGDDCGSTSVTVM
jgi:hypothetical protein